MESEFIGRQPIMNRNRGILGYRLLYGGASDLQYDPTHEETAIQTPERKLVLQFEEVLGGATGFIEVEIDALNSEFVAALNPKQCVIEIGSLDGYDPKQVKKNSVAICGTDACEATTSRSLLPGSIYPRSSTRAVRQSRRSRNRPVSGLFLRKTRPGIGTRVERRSGDDHRSPVPGERRSRFDRDRRGVQDKKNANLSVSLL
jgi:hypothetical protein